MLQDKLYELVSRLLTGTKQGKIKWTETADEDSFRTVLNAGLVRVERGPAHVLTVTPTDDFEYRFLVLDEKNKEIGRFIPTQSEQALALRNLWELAGASARNAEQKINSILQEVEGKLQRK